MPLLHEAIPVGPIEANCVLLACAETREAVIIDPGADADLILERMAQLSLRPVSIVLTHAHIDHLFACGEVASSTGCAVRMHPAERWLYSHVDVQAELLGWPSPPPLPTPIDVADGEELVAGRIRLRVLHTPGHSPGSISLLASAAEGASVLVSGDTLFRRSVGRTDLWGGSMTAIERSIRDKLYSLPGETVVLPGHGPATQIEQERHENPFVHL